MSFAFLTVARLHRYYNVILLPFVHRYLHRLEMLHRDLKSPNILLDNQFRAKVCDFGLTRMTRVSRVRIVHSPFTGVTRLLPPLEDVNIESGLDIFVSNVASYSETTLSIEDRGGKMTKAVGTTRWMAPEVFRGDRLYGRAVDVYSFGVVMWELMTRQTPWRELEGNDFNCADDARVSFFNELNHALQSNRRPTIPRDVELGFPHYVEVMKRCWAGDPADRPPFAEVVDELSACLREVYMTV